MKGVFSDGKMPYRLARKALMSGYWVKRKSKDFYLYCEDGVVMSSEGREYKVTSEDEQDEDWSLVVGTYEVSKGIEKIEWHYKFGIEVNKKELTLNV